MTNTTGILGTRFAEHTYYDAVAFRDGTLVEAGSDLVSGAGLRQIDGAGNITLACADAAGLPPDVVPQRAGPDLAALITRWRATAAALTEAARAADPRISRTTIWVRRQTQHVVITPAGAPAIRELRRRLRVTMAVEATEGSATATASCAVARPSGTEPDRTRLLTAITRTAARAAWHLRPGPLPDSPVPIVLGGMASGFFLHETLGHGLEADNVLGHDDTLGALRGHRIGPEDLTFVDDPSATSSWAGQRHDDEGVASEPTTLVRAGELTGLLHTRATAAALAEEPRGNGRCADFGSIPLARMTTTYAMAGQHSTSELLAGMPEALICTSLSGGQPDPVSGKLTFTASLVAYARDGVALGPIAPVQFSGAPANLLAGITAIGDDLTMTPAICVKHGQAARVSMGAPTLVLGRRVLG
ncbi:TldD protein [Allocatelliglobosispora scoriae]|uniref:TldD protein n=1 Tax=Allocatelliglobosispora scoriae TaxID=643052 RepID=A0A841C4J6_9ACTN|nr:TldD/PmbA family protein [Allocatelliglobosispora scoriae]MBB5874063.1 TldD protein [Allocatelliglobosispora scoriae]